MSSSPCLSLSLSLSHTHTHLLIHTHISISISISIHIYVYSSRMLSRTEHHAPTNPINLYIICFFIVQYFVRLINPSIIYIYIYIYIYKKKKKKKKKGGFGIFDDSCVGTGTANGPAMFPDTRRNDWGQQYGGVSNIGSCDGLPDILQESCRWRFEQNGFNNADNPAVTYRRV